MKEYRKFLKFPNVEDYDKVVPKSDEQKQLPITFQKSIPENAELIDLISHENFAIGQVPFLKLVNKRQSRRKFTSDYISLEELSFLLWSTQGVKKILPTRVLRTVPSSGAKSPFETYLVINRVQGLNPGLYRYISFSHKLFFVKTIHDSERVMGDLSYKQNFVGKASVVFCWVAIPYRTEWRYTVLAHKFIAIDLGIVTQNLYMASEALELGTVAIGYYDQDKLDNLLELDGEDEFVVLLAPVGRIK